MRISRAILLAIIAPALSFADPAAQAPATDASQDITLTCELLPSFNGGVRFNQFPDTNALKRQVLHDLIPAALKTLNLSPDAMDQNIIVGFQQTLMPSPIEDDGAASYCTTSIHVGLHLNAAVRPAAAEFLDQIIADIPTACDELWKAPVNQQIGKDQKSIADFEPQLAELGLLEDRINSLGIVDTSSAGIHELAHNLDIQKQQIALEAASVTAQQDALAQAVEHIRKDADIKVQDDPIARELQTIVNLKLDRLKLLEQQHKVGLASDADHADAESQAAEARVRLLERREAVARAAGGDALAELQKQLVLIQVNVAEDEARLKAIHEQADTVSQAVQAADQLNTFRSTHDPVGIAQQIAADNQEIRSLQNALAQFTRPVVRTVKPVNP